MPRDIQSSELDFSLSWQQLLSDPQAFSKFLETYGKEIEQLAKLSVSEFEFNFIRNPAELGDNIKKMLLESSSSL